MYLDLARATQHNAMVPGCLASGSQRLRPRNIRQECADSGRVSPRTQIRRFFCGHGLTRIPLWYLSVNSPAPELSLLTLTLTLTLAVNSDELTDKYRSCSLTSVFFPNKSLKQKKWRVLRRAYHSSTGNSKCDLLYRHRRSEWPND